MTIEYKNNLDDLLKFNIYNFKNSKNTKRNILNGRIFALVFTIITVLYSFFSLEFQYSIIIISLSITVSLLWFFFFPFFYTNSVNAETKTKYKKNEIIAELKINFCEGFFELFQKNQNRKYDNQAIDKIIILQRYIYLYLKDTNHLIIPLSIFKSESELIELLHYLEKYFDNKIKKG